MARLIVAKTGFDITSDKRNIVLDSNDTNLMIIDESSISGGTANYQHGLGYLPTTFEFYNYSTQWFPFGSPIFDTGGAFQTGGVFAEYDTDKVYFTDDGANSDIKLFISGNAADNSTGSGKNTASGKLKIAKAGFSINETDVRRLQFCSGLDTIKKDLSLSGQATLSSSGAFVKVEITHNLGYVPVVIAKIESNTYDNTFDGSMLPVNLSLFDVTPVSFYITSTKLVFFTENVVGNFTINYNIYRNKIE